MSHAAVEMAREVLDGLQGRRVLVLGAGEMSEGMAVALTASGVAEMVVANRTAERARALADRLGERAAVRIAPFADLAGAVAEADLVLTSTGADRPVLDFDIVAGAMSARPERPLMMVDIAVPRDVAPEVDALDGVTRLDLDDLRNWADRGRAQRAGEAAKVRSIVAEEIERYLVESTARQAAPLVAAMRERADLLRQNELERYAKKLADLPADQRAIVDALTKSLVNKLLHEPSVRLKEDAGTPRGERNSAAVRDLFGLQ
ncbi:MAG: glutamyl-tRNA reductase [Ilumatobacteraceae bacterium]